jgi:deazaflavin-dependent oxidoreductase (nitroreductase family)
VEDRAMAATRNAVVELFWRLHPKLYRWTSGRLGGRLMGMRVLLLTTTGRRTGQSRTTALTYLPRGSSFVVIASVLGEPRHPAWCLNLRENPEAQVQVMGDRIPVCAREADGEEREALWAEVAATVEDYREYAQRTERKIPVVVLDPVAQAG